MEDERKENGKRLLVRAKSVCIIYVYLCIGEKRRGRDGVDSSSSSLRLREKKKEEDRREKSGGRGPKEKGGGEFPNA